MLRVNFCHQDSRHTSEKLPLNIVANCVEQRSSLQEKTMDERCHNTDSDFQSFLLPLEQDFTKSSKGYSSRVANTDDKDFGCNKSSSLKPEDDNILINEKFSMNSIDNPHDNKPDFLEDCSKFDHPCLFNWKDDESSSDESIEYLGKCPLINDQINSNIDTDSDDSIIFSNTCDTKIEHNLFFCNSNSDKSALYCKSVKNGSDNSDEDWHEGCKESDYSPFFEKCNFELSMSSLPDTPLEENLNISFSELSIGCYINPCFEDHVFTESTVLRSVNEKWNDSMEDVSNEPHESKRVSFVPLPDLVSVHSFEPDDDGYNYSLYVLDQVRFHNRIEEFKTVIAPYLTPEHRANVYQRNYSS